MSEIENVRNVQPSGLASLRTSAMIWRVAIRAAHKAPGASGDSRSMIGRLIITRLRAFTLKIRTAGDVASDTGLAYICQGTASSLGSTWRFV